MTDPIARYHLGGGRRNRADITPQQFRRLLKRFGLSQMEASRVLHVDPRSVRRWALGESSVPGPVIAFFELISKRSKAPISGAFDRITRARGILHGE